MTKVRKIVDSIIEDITAGKIAPGEPLPTRLELSDVFDASNTTVNTAITFLRMNGYIAVHARHNRIVVAESASWGVR